MIALLMLLLLFTLANSVLIGYLLWRIKDIGDTFQDHKENIENTQMGVSYILETFNLK